MAKENKEGKNKSFILRIDGKTMEAIEQWAADEFRSVNGQILYLLDQSLKKNGRLPAGGGGRKKPCSPSVKRVKPDTSPDEGDDSK